MKAKDLYELGCDAYLQHFCNKHGYYYERDCWVGNDVGGVACIGDYFVDMVTIRTDIDQEAPEEEFIKWYDYCISAKEFGLTMPNFRSWLSGCPRTSDETFEKFRAMRNELFYLVEDEKRKNGDSRV